MFLKKMLFNVPGGIVAGLITVGILELYRKLCFLLRCRKFTQVFGKDILGGTNFHLVYAQLSLRPVYNEKEKVITHPYTKPGEESSGVGFSIERAVSSCEVRAAKYLTEIIGTKSTQTPILSSDYDIRKRLDISFVSFGGPSSNYKTRDAIQNEENQLIRLDTNFISAKSKRSVLRREPGFDYGLILKIHPTQFPRRVWLVCAGIGEWGTSGAAWYLAHKWKEIHDYSKRRPFAIIVRVKDTQDESAEPVVRVKNSAEAERYADDLRT